MSRMETLKNTVKAVGSTLGSWAEQAAAESLALEELSRQIYLEGGPKLDVQDMDERATLRAIYRVVNKDA